MEIKVGKKAVEMGWITPEQLKNCLRIQQKYWKQDRSVSLVECILQENLLDTTQIEIIEQQIHKEKDSVSNVPTNNIEVRQERKRNREHITRAQKQLSHRKKTGSLQKEKRKNISQPLKPEDFSPSDSPLEKNEELPTTMPLSFMDNSQDQDLLVVRNLLFGEI